MYPKQSKTSIPLTTDDQMFSGDFRVFAALKLGVDENNANVTAVVEGDSISTYGTWLPSACMRVWNPNAFRGINFPKGDMSLFGGGFALNGSFRPAVLTGQTGYDLVFDGGLTDGRMPFGYKNIFTASAGTTVAGNAWENEILSLMPYSNPREYMKQAQAGSKAGQLGQSEWFRAGDWLNVTDTTQITYKAITYENPAQWPDNAIAIMRGDTNIFANNQTSGIQAVGTAGFKAHTLTHNRIAFPYQQSVTNIHAPGPNIKYKLALAAGITFTNGQKFELHSVGLELNTPGLSIMFSSVGASTTSKWINTNYFDTAACAQAHALLGTTMFIYQGGANDSGTSREDMEDQIETYIAMRREMVPNCKILLIGPFDTWSSTPTQMDQIRQAYRNVAAAHGKDGGVAFVNLGVLLLSKKAAWHDYDQYFLPAPTWVSGTTYAAGDLVFYNNGGYPSYYQRVVAGAGTTAPNADSTNWRWIGQRLYPRGFVVRSTVGSGNDFYVKTTDFDGALTEPANDATNWAKIGNFDLTNNNISSSDQWNTMTIDGTHLHKRGCFIWASSFWGLIETGYAYWKMAQ